MKKQKNILSMAAALALMLAVLLSACSDGDSGSSQSTAAQSTGTQTTPAPKAAVNLITIQGPAGVAMANLWEKSEKGEAGNAYTVSMETSPANIAAKLTSGDADIAAMPTNTAANLYNKDGGIQVLALTVTGVLYFVEKGDSIRSVEDLRGKTIFSTGEGQNPEYILNYILRKNGLEPDVDVTVEFRSENAEMMQMLASGAADVGMVPEPFVSTVMAQNGELKDVLSVNDLWKEATGDDLMMSCVVARREFVEKNPEAVKAFLADLESSIATAASDVEGTAALCEKHGIIGSAAVAEKAIPRCNLIYVDGSAMKPRIDGYYQVLLDANASSIGGKVPDDAFYYKAS